MSAIDCVGHETRRVLMDVLRAMAWADGRLVDEERRAARGASVAFGLVLEGEAGVEALPQPLGEIGVAALTSAERRVVYACAAWMALADDVQTRRETLFLRRLRAHLKLSAAEAARAQEGAFAARTRYADPRRPWRELEQLVVGVARPSPFREAA